jgi:PAS domain S-box-containing protein
MMIQLRDSLSKKLTAMNMLVSGVALLLASAAFFAYDLITFRTNLISNTSVQAQIIGSNAVSPLIFNDPQSAEKTLSALRASQHIVYAGIYDARGHFFAGYWRQPGAWLPVLLPIGPDQRTDRHWFENGQFALVQNIVVDGKPVGIVYIRSDLGAIYDRLRSYGIILLVIVGASLIAALLISRVSQRTVTRPILNLADTALQVSRDKDFRVRAPISGDQDEVALLVDAFNGMLVEIQKRDSALQESERQFRTLANSIPQLAWMAESDGRRLWFNQRWYEYTGTTPEEAVGWGWQAVHDPEMLPAVLARWRTSFATGEPFEMTYPLRAADGTYRHFLTMAMPVRDASGKVVRWFGTNTDVTEQRRSEEALRQTEKLAATGRLAASIAHEINNPLEAVTNLVYLARRQPPNVEKYLKLADQELDRIAQITKNTLGFYRDSVSPTEIDVSEVLQEVLALYGRKLSFKNITLRPNYGADTKVLGYPGEVRQIFANLISNAIEALSAGGCLTIKTARGRAWDGSDRSGVRITFTDNGSGIAPEHRKKIFEPFFTTKKDVGTGLGLWLTLGLVEKHQGSLRVRSSVRTDKTWTVFSVFLPESPKRN